MVSSEVRQKAWDGADWNAARHYPSAAVRRIAELRLNDVHPADIARILNEEGYSYRGAQWTREPVANVTYRLWPLERWAEEFGKDGPHTFYGTEIVGICHLCGHYRFDHVGTCDAFPDGIPLEVQTGFINHHRPQPDDHGLQFIPKPLVRGNMTNNPGPTDNTTARDRLIAMWDEVVDGFLAGETGVPEHLSAWFQSYKPSASDPVVVDALPEPFLGRLDQSPAGVCLALNPGQAHIGGDGKPDFQSRQGTFADEIRASSYSEWARTWPYLREPWKSGIGANRHHRDRLAFLQRWFEDPSMNGDRMLAFELYPWHTARATAPMQPDPDTIRKYVWAPIIELGNPPVFAFGADWFDALERLGLREELRLGHHGEPYGSEVPSRTVAVFRDPSGLRVIAEKHSGGATPPNADEVTRLRDALAGRGIGL